MYGSECADMGVEWAEHGVGLLAAFYGETRVGPAHKWAGVVAHWLAVAEEIDVGAGFVLL